VLGRTGKIKAMQKLNSANEAGNVQVKAAALDCNRILALPHSVFAA